MSFLFTVLIRGIVLSGVGILALALLRRSSAATRAAMAIVFFAAMLALPLGLLFAPRTLLPPGSMSVSRIVSERLTIVAPLDRNPTGTVETPMGLPPAVSRPIPWETIALGGWALGAAGLILRTLVGWGVAVGWARRSDRQSLVVEGLTVGVSDEVAVPCAFWAGRSTILLPQSSTEWDENRRQAVLLHETAHIRRGDWAALLLSRFVVALYWPNPFVWLLARALRRAIEDAADDAVLRSGLAPTAYADHLLALAPKRRHSALVLPMASCPDVTRRIRLVLHPLRSRGSVSFATLALVGLMVGGLLVPLTAFAVAQRRHLDPKSIETSSPYVDIRLGKTKPGAPANGFVGRFADGTTAQVVQISMRTPRGIRSWRPDGEPIPEARRRKVQHLGVHYRSILVRYEKRTVEADGGLGSGPTTEGEPSMMEFNSNRNQPGPTHDTWESYQFISVPKEDGDRSSFTFALSNEPWRSYTIPGGAEGSSWRVPPVKDGRPEDANGHPVALRDVRLSHGTVHPVLRNAHGMYQRDKKGVPLRANAPATTFAFAPPDEEREYAAEVKAILRDGRTVKPFWNDNARHGDDFFFRYHFHEAGEEIREYRVRLRAYKNVEFLDVRLKPNAR